MKQNDPPPEQENPVEIVSPSTPAMETSQRPEKMGFWQTRYETIREADRAELREQRLKNMKLENETGREVIENKNLQHELKNLPRTHELRDQEVALAEEKLELERREIARRRVQLEADQKDEAELAKLKAAAEKLDAEIKLQQKKMQLKRAQHAAEQVGKPPKERSLTEAIDRRAAKAKIDKKAESHKKAIPGLEDEFDRAAQKDKDALIDE